MSLDPGVLIGSYTIVSALGAGGMGEVYAAHDAALDRHVAIKVLPTLYAADPDRVARFEREARTLAALSHPNIAAIYGLERAGSASVLVMELADGETLAARIARGRVPVDEATAIAMQIAAALEAAHEKGIVHRDLKPANIVISPSGVVKVLDFGLAKLADAGDSESALFNAANSPTIAASIAGTILGTAPYMSPEQARGKAVDKRADIWAFGCVLMEMLTGVPTFAGDTITDIVAAVLRNEPDWSALPADVPRPVRRIVRRCLVKDAAFRLHDVADARLEMQDVEDDEPHAPIGRRGVVPWLIAAASALAAVGLALRGEGMAQPPLARLDLNPPPGVELLTAVSQTLCIAPKGDAIGFVGVRGGVRQVYVRRLADTEARPVPGSARVNGCLFSPDGTAIGILLPDMTIGKASLIDGQVSIVARNVQYTSGAAWGADDRITFARGGALWQVPASGGQARQLTTLDAGKEELSHVWPAAVGDGKTILMTVLTGTTRTSMHVEAVATETGERQAIIPNAASPIYAPTGHIVFFREDALFAVPFDAAKRRATGSPARLVADVASDLFGGAAAAVSSTGSLVYIPRSAPLNRLVRVSRAGVERPLIEGEHGFTNPRLAGDGHRTAVVDNGDLWIHDNVRGTFTRVIPQATVGNSFPTWTPDNSRLIVRTRTGMRWVKTDGSGETDIIPGTSSSDFPTAVTPDGQTLLFQRQSATGSGDIVSLNLQAPAPVQPLISSPAYEGGSRLSTDGKWLAWASDESGRFEVYLRRMNGSGRKWPVSTEGGTQPTWRGDGRELFYRNGNKMMAVGVGGDDEPTLSAPQLLFERPYAFGQGITLANYDVTHDGTEFVMVKDTGLSRLQVVLNWFDELKRLAPTSVR